MRAEVRQVWPADDGFRLVCTLDGMITDKRNMRLVLQRRADRRFRPLYKFLGRLVSWQQITYPVSCEERAFEVKIAADRMARGCTGTWDPYLVTSDGRARLEWYAKDVPPNTVRFPRQRVRGRNGKVIYPFIARSGGLAFQSRSRKSR